MSRETMVTRCSTCRGWVLVLKNKWKVPHLARGRKRISACKGSSQDTDRPVITLKELEERSERATSR